MLYRSGFYRGGGIHMSALAGIDQALWDIKGKAAGLPVHQLLGGPLRDRIRVYSWIGGDRPSDTANAARAAVERGFTAVKMNATEELQFIDSHAKVDPPPRARAGTRASIAARSRTRAPGSSARTPARTSTLPATSSRARPPSSAHRGADLRGVAPGAYTLHGLPLRLEASAAAPARVVLTA